MQDAPTAVAVVGVDGVVSGWSEGGRLLLGWTTGEVVGHPVAELFVDPPSGFPGSGHDGAEPPELFTVRHRDGFTVGAVVTSHPLRGDGDRVLGQVLTLQRWGRRPVIADRAFEQCPFALGVYDPELRFLWVNASACRVMAHSEEQVLGEKYRELFPELDDKAYTDKLSEVARTGEPARLITVFRPLGSSHANAWATSMWPVRDAEGTIRAVANWGFDMSAEYWARQRLLLLNEASSGIGRTLDVVGTARELARTAVPGFADEVTVDLFDEVLRGQEPPTVAATPGEPVTLTRVAHYSTTQDADRLPGPPTPTPVSHPPDSVAAVCMATGGSAVQLAAEPSQGGEWAFGPGLAADPAHWPPGLPAIDPAIAADGLTGRMTVPLRAHGALLGVVSFARADRPETFTADDLILAEELTAKAAAALDNARRYTRERTTALTLQRSLLPRQLPNQEAIEVASRYLPAGSDAGVGGDWFDVIALSSARVALVVGDVVGHGLHASASMGRLRTAVRTLADVDLPPDELLTHMDDLVIHLGDHEPGDDSQTTGESGATCLYAVYDPASRRCTMASAGHPLPLVISPDGTRTPVPLQPGPPLGIGGLPFECVEVELPAGSLLALFTDGLVESRERDIDRGVEELFQVLVQPAASLDALCGTAMDAVLPPGRADDAALLLARTRVLAPDHIADLDIEPEPTRVAHARQFALEQVDAWGLSEVAFVTELVVSELVTNAIRYGQPPIRLRLIRDTSLICEVTDGSDTAPHLRRARAYDEGGRGLLLVAQLTSGWGTRHSGSGKTIWCAQSLG